MIFRIDEKSIWHTTEIFWNLTKSYNIGLKSYTFKILHSNYQIIKL